MGATDTGVWQAPLERELARGLPAFLPGQRWFGAKARRIASAGAEDCVWLREGEEPCALVPCRVEFTDGSRERYALLVSLVRDPGEAPVLARIDRDGESRHLIEGAHRAADAGALLRHLDRAHEIAGARGGLLRFGDLPAGGGPVAGAVAAGRIAPLGMEQSNTSLRVGDGHVFKLFRRLEPGENPEVEVGRFLETHTRFRSVPALRGSVSWFPAAGGGGTVGALQERVENEGDGWRWTLARLGGALAGIEPPGLLEGEMLRLGTVTADMHAALASGAGVPGFEPEPVTDADARARTAAFHSATRRTLALLAERLSQTAEPARAMGERLLGLADRLAAAAELPPASGTRGFLKIRVHGDYHLGQTLKTPSGFVVLDFEGEPARSLEERRRLQCALKDVSGMLRSFDYAVATARPNGADHGGPAPPLRQMFLRGYEARAVERGATFLPEDAEARRRWRTFFELDKALYEIEYELQNRPDWVRIPLRGMLRLLGEEAA